MAVLSVLRVLLVLLILAAALDRSECVRCFTHFNLTQGQCDDELGEVDEEDCCQNHRYGYMTTDGTCHYCGPSDWSPWSPWSPCNVLCGEGVTQRSRKCFGVDQSQCQNPEDNLQVQVCSGGCCDAKGWDLWLSWSSCSVTCGGGGVRERKRICASPRECLSACSGPSEETETCPTLTCPVHGRWSSWSGWSQCSGPCTNNHLGKVSIPSRGRQRHCNSPAPSGDTVPNGNGCPGNGIQVQDCSELPNCPADGSWGAWSAAGPCSVPCGEGLQLSTRRCDNPTPKYGGALCPGSSTRSSVCQSPCPVDGFWTSWSSWSECSSSCVPPGRTSVRTHHRSCSNPAPSADPPGIGCHGDDKQTGTCNVPPCPVDGAWGSWSPFSSCPVTCGMGLQVSTRTCDSPAPKYGGKACSGEGRQTSVCNANVHCPVDGVWSEWSPWNACKHPFVKTTNFRCRRLGGSQVRERTCLHRAHNGSICRGHGLSETRVCYDVHRCYLKGNWEGWEPWSLCRPSCGDKSRRFRKRHCEPDYSEYRPTIGRQGERAVFFGSPQADCGAPPEGGEKFEEQPCLNAPPCP
ncbi:properdin-like [Brachionichthys hirsutus]|uniref:properdin-like n=1 Tax=Brachionichthys hirsutus TaxID=412623 RepID=UPI003604A7F8